MGLLNFFARRKALSASPGALEAFQAGVTPYPALGGTNQRVNQAWVQMQSASYAWTYQNQPAVRMVVDFIARNASQLGLKLYERVSDTEREQAGDHPAAELMRYPNTLEPPDKWVKGFISDYLVHDNAYALKLRPRPGAPLMLIRIPVDAVGVNSDARFTIASYTIYKVDGSTLPPVPSADMIHWHDYNPADPRIGISRLQTLRDVLAEDAAAQSANVELLKSGLARPGYIERPLEAPDWSQDDRDRFMEMWANAMKQSGRRTPVLDEGMKFEDFGVTPKDAEMLDGRRFTIEEVCNLYGVLPAALGIGSGDSEAATKRFYADVLAPLTKELACQLDFSLLRAEYNTDDYYFEFDLNEKLRGDLETRFPQLTASVGAPWLTRNEARAKENLPPIDGGDEIVTPLNVQVGDNPRPAPNVMPIQDPNKPPQDGSHREEPKSLKSVPLVPRRARADARRDRWAREYEKSLRRFFARQQRTLTSKSSKAAKADRWDEELARDLRDISDRQFKAEGDVAGFRLATPFDPSQGQNWLDSKAEGAATAINETTQAHIEADGAEAAFSLAKEKRALDAGMEYATSVAAFAVRVATEQAPGTRTVTIDGGDCEICAEFQGTWPADDVPGWPAYHPNCNCVADPS